MNIRMQTAGAIMSKELITIHPAETLRSAARLLKKHRIHCLLVPPLEPQRCAGILTIKDIIQVLCQGEPQLLDTLLVQDAMTNPTVSVQRDFLIADCLQLMRVAGVRSVPVLEGTRLVGLLSFTDVVHAVALEDPADTGA